MRAVHSWVANHGSHLLFLYGQDDPWSAQPFVLGSGAIDSTIYTIAGGNHVSPYSELPTAQESTFVETLRTWAGLAAQPAGVQAAGAGCQARPCLRGRADGRSR